MYHKLNFGQSNMLSFSKKYNDNFVFQIQHLILHCTLNLNLNMVVCEYVVDINLLESILYLKRYKNNQLQRISAFKNTK